MGFSRKSAMLGAAIAACLWATAQAASPSKLDARIRARRGSASQGYAPAGMAPGPRQPVLIRVSPGTPIESLRAAFPDAEFGVQAGDVVTASASDAVMDSIAGDARVRGISGAVRAHPTMDVVRSSSTSGGVALGTVYGSALNDLSGVTGAGVIVGIVDTGIDWTHKDFINDTPNTSRILAIWDQTIAAHADGPLPSGFAYGAEYTNAKLTLKLQGGAVTINTKDTDGHGTHVASLAAGDGLQTAVSTPTFQGMAPSADIVFVKTTFSTPAILDGVSYIIAKAASLGKRAVINLSLGTQLGPHDGTSAFESGLGAMAATTPIVVAMGNDGTANPHAAIDIGVGGGAVVAVQVNNPMSPPAQADIEIWGPGTDGYSVSVAIAGVAGSVSAAQGVDASGTIGGHLVQIFASVGATPSHPLGHRQIYVQVNRAAGVTGTINTTLIRTTSGGTGHLDGFVDPSIDGISFASHIDQTMTLGEPACSLNVFGVASYASKKFWLSKDGFNYSFGGQSPLGYLSTFSSQGPTRDGRQEPEVSAPGDVIGGAYSADTLPVPADSYILTDLKHRILRGTSMATPIVAGILAGRLQWGPTRTVAQLRALLRAQARADTATGAVPSFTWGYGKAAGSPQPTSPPIGVTATTLGPSSVTWNWGLVTGADSYTLYYSTDPTKLIVAGIQPPYIHTALAANTTTGVLIKGVGGGIEGPGGFISTSTLAAPPAALPTATPHVDSATVSWTPCPASPAAVSCWGYSVSASTAANGTGTPFGAITLNRADASLVITGLVPLTQYYFRQATLNFFGAGTATGPVTATTLTDVVAPVTPTWSAITASSIRFDWSSGGNAPNSVYVASASTSPSFSGVVFSSSTRNLFALFTGMSVNASYYFKVQAAAGPYLTPAAPIATLAADPVLSTSPYSAVTQTGFQVAWSSGANGPDTLYQAEISASPTFSPLAASSSTRNAFAAFTGLTANTLYYARALTISQGGFPTAYTAFGSTPTLVFAPVLPPQPFSGQAAGGFTFSFLSGGNPVGTSYVVRISTDPAFASLTAIVNTTALSASFSGLSSNRLYYAAAAALNLSGAATAFTGAVSTATTVAATGAPGITGRSVNSLSAVWNAGTLGPGTLYTFESSPNPAFGGGVTSTTANAFATVSPLLANSVLYLRVRALSLNPPTPDGPWTAFGTASTLAPAPSAAASPFPLVGVASITVAWSALPLAPPFLACEGYLAELSPEPAFATILRSSSVAPGAATANFGGLVYGTVYYTRVASLDWEGNPNYFVIGSTRTNAPALSSGTVGAGALTLTLPSAFLVTPTVTAQIEAGTFPPGTVVTMLSGVTLDLTNPRSSVARLAPLGPFVGIDISAGGLQPLKPVRLSMTYDPLLLPAGEDARRLLIARYDDAAGLWTLTPSAVDTSARRIVATLDHFSSYSPFFAAAGAALADGIVFPQPWEAGEPRGAYGAQTLTFANYPDATKVRLMSLTGEQIWEGVAGANGILTWDGRNSHGRSVASGTYYAIIEGAGARKVRRVVVIR